MITHAQQLPETHWASIFVYSQLFYPEGVKHNICILNGSNTQSEECMIRLVWQIIHFIYQLTLRDPKKCATLSLV